MKKEALIKKWLDNELSTEELIQFQQLEEYESYMKLSEKAIRFKAPSFDEETWKEASNNKAVALLKTEKDIQQNYISQYSTVTRERDINLVGVSKLPFQPIGDKLIEFSKFLTGLDFVPQKSIEIEEDVDTIKVKLYYPNSKRVKLKEKSYFIDYREYPIDLPPNVNNLKVRKVKTEGGATYTYRR